MMSFTSSGVALKSSEQIMALTLTLLPEPVVPATRRCGILARSKTIGVPTMSLPRTIASFDLFRANASLAMISLR
jgi:hypothetical protein